MTRKLVGLLLVLVLSLNLLLAVPSSAESVTLRFIDVSPSPVRQEYYETTFAKFKEETGISVVYESVPWDDAANKLTVLGTSGQLPDVLTTWAGWLGQFTAAGWVHPLTDYIGDTTDQYADTVTKLVWKGEKELYGDTYTVPDGVMVKGVFVRKDWAADAGLNLDPAKGWTYSEYFDAVYKLTDPEKNHYGTSFRGARGAFDPLYVYLLSFSGGRAYADDGAALFDTDECVKAYERWCGLYLDGCAPKDAINWGFIEMVDNFTGGLTGTLINDSEVAATCIANMTDDQWFVMPMPRSDADGKIYNTVNSPYASRSHHGAARILRGTAHHAQAFQHNAGRAFFHSAARSGKSRHARAYNHDVRLERLFFFRLRSGRSRRKGRNIAAHLRKRIAACKTERRGRDRRAGNGVHRNRLRLYDARRQNFVSVFSHAGRIARFEHFHLFNRAVVQRDGHFYRGFHPLRLVHIRSGKRLFGLRKTGGA